MAAIDEKKTRSRDACAQKSSIKRLQDAAFPLTLRVAIAGHIYEAQLRVVGAAKRKKLSSRVRPGVFEVRAKAFRLVTH